MAAGASILFLWDYRGLIILHRPGLVEAKHRGFAFITFTQAVDAQDAIDNMDMNEFRGRVLKVNLAKPQKGPIQGAGNRAGASLHGRSFLKIECYPSFTVWETEEWLQNHAQHAANREDRRARTPDAAEKGDDAMEE